MILNHISQEKYYEMCYSSFFSSLVAVVADSKHNIYCTDKYSGVKVRFLHVKECKFVLKHGSSVNVLGYVPPPAARLRACVGETARESSASCLISQRAKDSTSFL